LTNLMKKTLYDDLFHSIDQKFGGDISDFSIYQDDPVGFGERVLGEEYTLEVKALMESVRDNPVTIAKSANAVGKTHGAARVALWWYKCHSECQVYTAAAPPESNLKKLLWGEIGSIVENHEDIFKGDTLKSLHISRSARVFISGVLIPASGTEAQREAKFSGKHAPHLLFILDEGDAIPDECYRGIESCMSGGHARLLVMFNPRAQLGEAYRMERDGRANIVHLSAFNHPNVVSGKDHFPGAVTRDTTVRRINEWSRKLTDRENIDAECFELPQYLEGTTTKSHAGYEYPALKSGHYKIMEPSFSYMVLGQYPAQGSTQLISTAWIAEARSRWDAYVAQNGEVPPIGAYGIMGVDVAEFGADANATCIRYGGFIEQITTWGGMDILSTADRVADEYKARDLFGLNVDATGVGAGVAPKLKRKGVLANAVKVASSPTETTELGEFNIMRDQLWWSVREWLRTDPGAMLPPDSLLIEELQTPAYEILNGKVRVMKKITMRELIKRSPDRADALCLTFYQPELLFPNL
jgi:hypothetical protein